MYLGKIAGTKPAEKGLVEAIRAAANPDTPPEQLRIQMCYLKGGTYEPDPGDSIRIHKKDD